MLKMFSLIFLFFLVAQACAQSDTSYLSLLYHEIRLIQPRGIIYYADKARAAADPSFLSSVNDGFDYIQKHGVTFSAAEKKYIIRQLKEVANIKWPDSLFLQSKRLGGDTIIHFVDRRGRAVYDSLTQAGTIMEALKYFKSERPWAFFFSRPVFLRHNTILLCYFMYFQTSCGENNVRVYRKENNQWKPWDRLGGGAW